MKCFILNQRSTPEHSDLIGEKLSKLTALTHKMVESEISDRPNCEEILKELQDLSLTLADFEDNVEFKLITSKSDIETKEQNFYHYFIQHKYKLYNNRLEIEESNGRVEKTQLKEIDSEKSTEI